MKNRREIYGDILTKLIIFQLIFALEHKLDIRAMQRHSFLNLWSIIKEI